MSGALRMPRALHRRMRAFLADAKGLAAVELALILPLALMLMSLVVFGGQAFGVQRRVTLAATTVANIFAQANNVNTSTITAPELNQNSRVPEPDPLPLRRQHRLGSSVAIAGHGEFERDCDRNGQRQLGQRQRNSPPMQPATVSRSVDRLRLC